MNFSNFFIIILCIDSTVHIKSGIDTANPTIIGRCIDGCYIVCKDRNHICPSENEDYFDRPYNIGDIKPVKKSKWTKSGFCNPEECNEGYELNKGDDKNYCYNTRYGS